LRWLEISVTTDSEAAEAVAELFNRYGQGGAVLETPLDCFENELPTCSPPDTVIVKTYLAPESTTAQALSRLEEGLWHLSQIYHIPAAVVRLCLQALEVHLTPGRTVLDVGTGSGVLAIAAAGLGARSVLALDADPGAVTVAEENVALNGVADKVTVRHGSLPGGDLVPWHFMTDSGLELLKAGQFDLILINILAPVIVGMAPALAARCARGGSLITAGLIESQEEGVVEALQEQRFQVIERAQEKDWVSLVARRG
jgi:ribosomal protein L11 methylase PrmA